jgi:Transposase DNA-binding/Transposase Tn5 dimerisation domain
MPAHGPSPRVDLAAAGFADHRLRVRLGLLLDTLDRRPNVPLPSACRGWAARKAAYRFLDHPHTTVPSLLPALVAPTVAAAAPGSHLLAIHDSTSFNYSHLHHATGLGFLNDSPTARGLHLHSSLAVDPQGRLLGILHLHFWVRCQFRSGSDDNRKRLPIEDKESFKWLIGVRACERALAPLPARPRLIHVMDREGDIHEVFAEFRALGHQAVVRCAQDRRVHLRGGHGRAKAVVAQRKALGRISLRVPCTDGSTRLAEVELRSARLRLAPDSRKHKGRQTLRLWLVEVREVSAPPPGQERVLWWLWTNRAARTLSEVAGVLASYRARWRIEEWHRVLKTVCRVEKLRLQDGERLMKAITLQGQIAARVVALRDGVKQAPQARCEEGFSAEEWQALYAVEHGRAWRQEDGQPSLADVVRWLGKLGGHLGRKRDGLPGAELLGRGLAALELVLLGRRAALAEAAAAVAAAGQGPPLGHPPPTTPPPSHPPPRG